MAAISSISNGEALSSVRTKLNDVITEINLLDPTGWVDYSATSTIVGWSSFTTKQILYRIVGKQIFVIVAIEGTSNSTSASFTLPSNAINLTNYILSNGTNNGGYCIQRATITNNSNIISHIVVNSFNSGTSFTSTGTKGIFEQFYIQIA